MRLRSSWILRAAPLLFALQLVSCRSGGSLQHKCEPTDCNTTLCPPCTDPRLDRTKKPPTTSPENQAIAGEAYEVDTMYREFAEQAAAAVASASATSRTT